MPDDLTFMTKLDIAIDLINEIKDSGNFPARWLGCGSFLGINKDFIGEIAKSFYYFADVHAKTRVFVLDVKMGISEYIGRGPRPHKIQALTNPISVSEMASNSDIPWQTAILGEGSKGLIIGQIKCFRVLEYRDGAPGRENWFYIRKYADGKIKYSLSNAPADTP